MLSQEGCGSQAAPDPAQMDSQEASTPLLHEPQLVPDSGTSQGHGLGDGSNNIHSSVVMDVDEGQGEQTSFIAPHFCLYLS